MVSQFGLLTGCESLTVNREELHLQPTAGAELKHCNDSPLTTINCIPEQ